MRAIAPQLQFLRKARVEILWKLWTVNRLHYGREMEEPRNLCVTVGGFVVDAISR